MRRNKLLALLLLSASIVLCGCNDGTKEEGAPDDISSGSPTYGGSIVVGITQDLDSLDPHIAVAAGTDEILFNVFEGLVKPDKDGNFVEAVAERYQISADAMTYTFTLRDGVKFHNGKKVTAEDVVYSLKRCAGLLDVQDPNVVVESALSVVTDISAQDDRTVVLTLSKANTELLPYLTCAIIPCDYDAQGRAPVGTGPFRFVSYAPLESFVMERYEDYYGTRAYLDKVTFKIYANSDAAFLELLAGKIDIFPYLTEEQASQLTASYSIEVGSMNLVQALFLNNQAEPLNDVRVRQALCYAVNRQEILDMLSGGRGTVIGTNMVPGLSSYYDSSLASYYAYDVEKAKALLADAGYANGLKLTITVSSNYQYHMDTAQIIVEQLKKAGITAKIEPIEWSAWLSDVYRNRKYQTTIVGLDSNLAPSDVLKRYQSEAKNNFPNYVSTEYDEAFEKALNATDASEKIKWYKEAQALLTKDAASVYLQDPALLTAVNKKLGGYTFYPVYVQDMSVVYYKEQK